MQINDLQRYLKFDIYTQIFKDMILIRFKDNGLELGK
jgi:hypothetical protein